MTRSRALLSFQDATVGYDRPVVSGALLEVRGGEIVGLIGPNGSGKTTMLRAVTGGARVLAGSVALDGRPVGSYRRAELARIVGVLPQAVPELFAFTARQYVEMGRHPRLARFADLGTDDRLAVDRALALTDTERLAGEGVDTLSGGDVQRLTLAQALAQEPALLMLDEPTSHLDLNHRLQVLDVVRTLADEGLAVLAVFHDLDMAARYSDRLAVVHAGTLRHPAPPEDVLTSEMLAEVFGVRAVTGTDPVTGSVQVTPIVRSDAPAVPRGARVVVISGSGTGAAVMRRLVLAGYEVTTGALPVGDTDEQVAAALGAGGRRLEPYGAMTVDDEAAVADAVDGADAVVVCAGPYGRANLGNMRAATRAAERTVLVGHLDASQDFANGEALALWNALVDGGAVISPGWRDAVAWVEEVSGR